MTLTTSEKIARPVVPTPEDIRLAKESTQKLAALRNQHEHAVVLTDTHHCVELQLSTAMLEAITEIILEMAAGRAIRLIPVDTELTTQEAAALLNVSRPYLIKLIEEHKIPCRTVGRYRRIRYEDLLKYQQLVEERRQVAMDEMVAQAQELSLGY